MVFQQRDPTDPKRFMTQEEEQELEAKRPEQKPTKEQKDYFGRLQKELCASRKMREQQHPEFDGMTYEQYYETNAKAGNAFVPPKKNETDIRIVTGTTLEKKDTLTSALLNFNFEPNCHVFDQEDASMYEFGETAEALIQKSRDIERPDYDELRPLIYSELCTQGNVFLQETWEQIAVPQKKLETEDWDKAIAGDKIWTDLKPKIVSQCRLRLLSGMNVYMGSVKEFFVEDQPYIFTRDYVPYSTAEAMFGHWPNWKYVRKKVKHFGEDQGDSSYGDWSMIKQEDQDYCEVIKYENKSRNEFNIIINGVMMLRPGFPLSAFNGRVMYSLVKGDLMPISRYFAYSKSIPAKTKVSQQMLDETYRLMILKNQRHFANPMANNTGDIITNKIFFPGTITDDIDPEKLKPIGDVTGVGGPELAMAQFLKEQIDQQSVSPIFEGQSPGRPMTATEVTEIKKQGMAKLGLSIWGVTNMEEKLAWLRLYNIMHNWTRAEDVRINKAKGTVDKVYKTIMMEEPGEDGQPGMKVIEFNTEMPDGEQIFAEERLMQRRMRMPVRKTYLNPEVLRTIEMNMEITIEPTERNGDALERAQFEESLDKALKLWPDRLNMEYMQAQFAKHAKWDKEKAFITPAPVPPQQPGMPVPGAPGQPGQPQGGNPALQQLTPRANPGMKPSLNTLARA